MLTKKKVVISSNGLNLWDEANNFVASYDRFADQAMCRFLTDMIDRQCYDARFETAAHSDIGVVSAVLV